MSSREVILELHDLVLVFNHAIYFKKLEETVYGVLAEDTNYMIQNIGKYSEISIEEIERNLEQLREIIKSNNKL